MADQDQRARVAAQMLLQPDRGLEVEMVGGLVEQQEVGLEEQHAGQRHAHPPAAGERGQRLLLRRVVEAQALEDPGGAGRCGRRRRSRCSRLWSSAMPHRVRPRPGLGEQAARARCRSRAPPPAASARRRAPPGGPCRSAASARHPHRRPRRAAARPRSGAAASTCRCRCGRPGPPACRPGRAAIAPSSRGRPAMRRVTSVRSSMAGRPIPCRYGKPNPG